MEPNIRQLRANRSLESEEAWDALNLSCHLQGFLSPKQKLRKRRHWVELSVSRVGFDSKSCTQVEVTFSVKSCKTSVVCTPVSNTSKLTDVLRQMFSCRQWPVYDECIFVHRSYIRSIKLGLSGLAETDHLPTELSHFPYLIFVGIIIVDVCFKRPLKLGELCLVLLLNESFVTWTECQDRSTLVLLLG